MEVLEHPHSKKGLNRFVKHDFVTLILYKDMNYFSRACTPDGSKTYCPLKVIRIMKLTFFLLVSLSLGAYAKGNAQSVSLSVKDAKLEQVLTEIGKQTQYRILYNDELLQTAKSVSLNVKDASI